MNTEDDASPGCTEFDEVDPVLAEWVAQLADRARAGDPLDLKSLAAQNPERAEQLLRLLPTIMMMAALKTPDSPNQDDTSSNREVAELGQAPLGRFRDHS